jgi:uncharacterized protein with HEPN domain
MDNRSKKLLYDIYTAINNINTYIGDDRIFEFYENNAMLQDAVERNIEIIGEAVNSLLRIEPDIEITNARRIVDARNKIIHGYDEIENTQIWGIIVNHLPVLLSEVERYLKDN